MGPLTNPPLWPYTMYFRMPHRCHGDLQKCPTRSHAVWEIVMNELDRREDPTVDEDLPGCAMVDSCSNILSGDQFYNFLTHNFYRHYDQNRAPMSLFFHAAWLKNNPEFLDAFLYWVDEIIESHNDVYFVTMTQVIQWIQNPQNSDNARNFEPWKERCHLNQNKHVLPQTDASYLQKNFLGKLFICTLVSDAQTTTHGLMILLEMDSFKCHYSSSVALGQISCLIYVNHFVV